MRSLGFLAILLALFSALYSFLDARLEQFYIFEPDHLHDLSQRAIAAHGNNTRGVVDYIVAELDQKVPSQYVNKDEEWVFNNAGGAMGAMYIIHASMFSLSFSLFSLCTLCVRVCGERVVSTEPILLVQPVQSLIKLFFSFRYHGVPDYFRCVFFPRLYIKKKKYNIWTSLLT